jgi:endonuclease/exonuclease/phosphatase family metal-dependent hydrolase
MKTSRRIRTPKIIRALRNQERSFANGHSRQRGDLVVASYNIHKCVGTDGRFDPRRTADVINELGADIVALQEADKRFGARDGLLDLDELHKLTGLAPVSVARTAAGHGWHGNALLYRSGSVLAVDRISLPGAEPRGAIVVDLELEAGPLRLVAAHLGLLRRSRARQVETLVEAAQACGARATVIMGDLNEWRLGDRSSLNGLHPTFGPMNAALASFPAQFPVFALDRVVGCPHGIVTRLEVHDTPLSRVASDHLPIKAYLDLEAVTGGKAAAGEMEIA